MTSLFGPLVEAGGTHFRLHAAEAGSVEVRVRGEIHPLEKDEAGFWSGRVEGVVPGDRYRFRVDGTDVPDPAARRQEGGPGGWSVVQDPAVFGRNARLGRPWAEMVIAEVHVGTATPEGTFRALAGRLDHFVDAGYTAIQLMPVNGFPGRRNWGYDGVLLYAPAEPYGPPEDLVALVAAAHRRGLAILLDVVYNHFGPDGNFIPTYDPSFFDQDLKTPWGAAIDFRRDPVRRFFVDNALMWVQDYGFDGLRFDAVHAYAGEGRLPFLRDLSEALTALSPRPHLVLENEHNLAELLERDDEGEPLRFTAQWNDDFHHPLHVLSTGEHEGYYAAYAEDPVGQLGRVLSEGFAYQGDPSPLHEGAPRGQPSAHLSPTAFVSFTQNHDQVGNRALGERLTELAPIEAVNLLRFVTLLSPQIPMLFMGEEFGTKRRFPFFCDFSGDLAEAVRSGRRAEFAGFAAFSGEEIPDPLADETFASAKLDWSELSDPDAAAALETMRRLTGVRRTHVVPRIASRFEGAARRIEGTAVSVRWCFAQGDLAMVLNPAAEEVHASPVEWPGGVFGGEPVATTGTVTVSGAGVGLGPWSAALWVRP